MLASLREARDFVCQYYGEGEVNLLREFDDLEIKMLSTIHKAGS
jgi:hypothetical protein